MIIYLRNRLFDCGLLKSLTPKTKTIVIGNLALGGTGKSPHTEYILRTFRNKFKLAVLSRGYKRKTTGYLLATDNTTAKEIGDEPMQYHMKFDNIKVAVCEDRILGVNNLSKVDPKIDAVILDDAFQHRKLKPNLNILLTTYSKPYFKDIMVPTGTLRDNKNESKRADIIVVTKCPSSISQKEKEYFIYQIKPTSAQNVFFSNIDYFPAQNIQLQKLDSQKPVIIVSGIASHKIFTEHCQENYLVKDNLNFKDHYDFTLEDLTLMEDKMSNFVEDVVIVTTEKDFVKLHALNIKRQNPLPIYYVPIEINWIEGKDKFDNIIRKTILNE